MQFYKIIEIKDTLKVIVKIVIFLLALNVFLNCKNTN
jgi:hypothetical protein